MNENAAIVRAWQEARAAGADALLATVVGVSGSAYRRPGARMLVVAGPGWAAGSISGGCLESDVLRKAWWRTENGAPAVVMYDSTDDDDLTWGLGCNGVVRVLLERLAPGSPANPVDFLAQRLQSRDAGLLATVVSDGPHLGQRLGLTADGVQFSTLAPSPLADAVTQDAVGILASGHSQTRTYSGVDVFHDVVHSPTPLVIFGAGHDAAPLARMARELGWHVTIVDTHAPVARPSRFPEADGVTACAPADVPAKISFTSRTVAVVMTHSYAQDLALLPGILQSPAPYVGLLGPKSRAARLLAEIADNGLVLPPDVLAKLRAPIGLDIGASDPAAIALSILAEAQAALAGRGGGPLRERDAPIYDAPETQLCPANTVMPGIIILAAGGSSRLGRPKQLVSFGGVSLLRRAAQTACATGFGPVAVVLGASLERLTPELDGLPVAIVPNPDWERGMGASVRAGLGALLSANPELDAVLLMLCDQPLLSPAVLAELVDTRQGTGLPIAACAYEGVGGVPALFGRELFPELLALPDSGGAKSIIKRHTRSVALVAFPEGVLDIDTPADCVRLARTLVQTPPLA